MDSRVTQQPRATFLSRAERRACDTGPPYLALLTNEGLPAQGDLGGLLERFSFCDVTTKAAATLTTGTDTANPLFCLQEAQRVDWGGGYTALPLDAEERARVK